MPARDGGGQRQAEAAAMAGIPGGEEGIEDRVAELVGEAGAAVLHLDHRLAGLRPKRHQDGRRRIRLRPAAVQHRIARIGEELEQRALQLRGAAADRQDRGLCAERHLDAVLGVLAGRGAGRRRRRAAAASKTWVTPVSSPGRARMRVTRSPARRSCPSTTPSALVSFSRCGTGARVEAAARALRSQSIAALSGWLVSCARPAHMLPTVASLALCSSRSAAGASW
jgi:hypothetical protein